MHVDSQGYIVVSKWDLFKIIFLAFFISYSIVGIDVANNRWIEPIYEKYKLTVTKIQ